MHPHTDSYAQNREDIILAGFFNDEPNGFYVDIGANDPVEDSVTKYFYLKGWRGVHVEPIKRHYEALVADRPDDIVIRAGISDAPGELTLREYHGSGLSTFSKDMQASYRGSQEEITAKYEDYAVPVFTLRQIFADHNVERIHFMKVDVEGFEYAVLDGNDWERYRPEVICIEANHVNKDWHPLLKRQGYELAFFDGLNEYFRDGKAAVRRQFAYVPAVISREPILNGKARLVFEQRMFKERQRFTAYIEKLQAEVAQLNQETLHLERYGQEMAQRLDEIISLRKHARKVMVHRLRSVDDRIIKKLGRSQAFTPAEPAAAADDDLAALLTAGQAADRQTAERFVEQTKPTAALAFYTARKQTARKLLKRVRRHA